MTTTDFYKIPIAVKNVRKTYPDGFKAIKNVSFHIQKGAFTVLLGLNGAGKTSLISLITGLNHITAGSIQIFGSNIFLDTYTAKAHMGIMPQEINFNLFTRIIDALVYHGGYYGISQETVIQRAKPLLKKARLYQKMHLPIQTLSGGMKRILMLIRALIQQPKVLILDEPTANLDIEIRRIIWDILRAEHQKGMTVLLTTHNLEEAQLLCTHVLILHHGKIVMNRALEDAIDSLEERCYSIKSYNPLPADITESLSNYKNTLRSNNTIDFFITKNQDLGTLICQLHSIGIKIQNIAPSTHQLEQLLHEATL